MHPLHLRPTLRTAVLLTLALALVVAPPAAASGSMFGAYYETLHDYSQGSTWYPVVGDLDLDGRDDLVLLRTDENTYANLLVRFGEADGRLSGIPLVLALPGETSMDAWPCIDDLDGDGTPDIVIGATTELFVVRGLGARAFASAMSWPELSHGYVPVADLNGDDIPDYACVNFPGAADSVRIRFGAGGLMFTPGLAFELPGAPGTVSLCDVNQDGLLDIFAGRNPQMLFLNAGGGTFTPLGATGPGDPDGDFTGDGLVDLLAPDGVRPGNGDGTFQAVIPLAPSTDPQCVTDLNEDGRLDIVGIRIDPVAQGGVTYVEVALGNGDGAFGPESQYRTCRTSQVISCGDFDQDGHEDLVLARWDSASEVFMFGRGTGDFRQAARTFPAGAFGSVHTGNLGSDPNPDIVVRSSTASLLSVLLAEGAAEYAAPVSYPTVAVPTAVAIGDLDGDDRDDVVVGYGGTLQLSVWLAQPDGSLGPRIDTPTAAGTSAHRLADLDGNGALDLVTSPGSVWREGNGNGTFGSSHAFPGSVGSLFEIVDLDGNGALDIVTTTGNGVRVMLASGPGVYPAYTDYSGTTAPSFVGTGFFDTDTILDVVVRTDSVRVFLGLGDGLLAPPVSLGYGAGTFPLVGDVNADGLTDMLGLSGSLAVWASLGTGGRLGPRFGFGPQYLNAGGPGLFTLADADGNGAPDIVVGEQTNVVTVLLNQTITPNVGVPPVTRPATRLAVRATPNPAVGGRVALRLELPGAAPVEVQVFDLSGRRVSGASVARPAGPGLTLALEGTERLAPGLYLVRVRQGSETATARVCLVR